MTDYLPDTDICIFYLKGKFQIAEKIASVGKDHCFVSEMTIGELLYGAHNSDRFEKRKDDHMKVLSVANLKHVFDSLNTYGKEKARLRKLGQLIPEIDLYIATTAVHHGMTLVTNNTKHMSRIVGIQLENWTRVEDNRFIS